MTQEQGRKLMLLLIVSITALLLCTIGESLFACYLKPLDLFVHCVWFALFNVVLKILP